MNHNRVLVLSCFSCSVALQRWSIAWGQACSQLWGSCCNDWNGEPSEPKPSFAFMLLSMTSCSAHSSQAKLQHLISIQAPGSFHTPSHMLNLLSRMHTISR